MRGTELVKAMVAAVDRLVSAREGTGALDSVVESIVGTVGRFGGKNATSNLEVYRSEMIMREIPMDRRLPGFPLVVSLSIHAKVLEVQAGFKTGRSSMDDSSRGTGLMTHFGCRSEILWNGLRAPGKGGIHRRSSRSSKSDLLGSRRWTGPCSIRAGCCSSSNRWMRFIGRGWVPCWRRMKGLRPIGLW